MAFQGDQIAVTGTATTLRALLVTAGLTPKTNKAKQVDLRIDPASAATVYWGGSGVTAVPANAAGALVAATTPSYTIGPMNDHSIDLTEMYLIATTNPTAVFVSIYS
jgi:hypothetical protein